MALDYSKFASSDDQHALFDKAPFNKEGARKKLVARIDRASKQFNGETTMKGGSDFERGHHNQIKYRPSLNGHAITLPGMKGDYFPTNSDSFEALLNAIRDDVKAGKFDDQIEAALSSGGQSESKSARASTSGGKSGATRDFSEQSRANIAARGRMRKKGAKAADVRADMVAAGFSEASVDSALSRLND